MQMQRYNNNNIICECTMLYVYTIYIIPCKQRTTIDAGIYIRTPHAIDNSQ